jgi:glycosyltransferase involved in cell wall biosynthesis
MIEKIQKVEYSLIVPVMNEEANVKLLYQRIVEVMNKEREPYEIIFVDDGSTDRTFEILKSLKATDSNLKLIKFRRNFGQSAAMGAGFEYASGNVIITLDGDLQNDPADIPNLVEKLKGGYDIVSGWRKNRKDKFIIRKVPSKIANGLIRYLTQVPLRDTGCSLKAYTNEITKKICLYGELHRFIPALARVEGAKIGEIVVQHHPRKFGRSKYNITRTFKVLMDLTTLNLFLKYFRNPLHFFGGLGVLLNLVAFLILLSMVYCVGFLNFTLADINVLLSTAFLFFAAGFQLFFFGLIANMVVKTGDKRDLKLYENYRSNN